METEIVKAEYEVRRESRLDKFLDHLNPMTQRTLSKKDAMYLGLMQQAYHWRTNFYSPDQVRKMIMKQAKDDKGNKYSYSMACQLYADMEYIFGSISKINKDAVARVLTEYYQNAIRIALKHKEGKELDAAELIGNLTDKIAKINKITEADMIDANKLMPQTMSVNFIITQNNSTVILPPKAPSDIEIDE